MILIKKVEKITRNFEPTDDSDITNKNISRGISIY